jgi:hypothetical protein
VQIVDPCVTLLADHPIVQIREPGTRLWPQSTLQRIPPPTQPRWATTADAFWDEFATLPAAGGNADRVEWMSMVLRERAVEHVMQRRRERQRLASGGADDGAVLVRTSSRPTQERGVARFRTLARDVIAWVRERGCVQRALLAEGCEWLAAAPSRVLEQLQRTARRTGHRGASLARAASASDVRRFFRALADRHSFVTSPLNEAPFLSLRENPEMVIGLLRFSTASLRVRARALRFSLRLCAAVMMLLLRSI